MPKRSKRPCLYPMCNELVDGGYCDVHMKQKEDEKKIMESKRESSYQRGYDTKWKKYRISFLKKNPICILCLKNNNTTPATIVDHIIPHKGDKKIFWDKNNHQALCKRCHDTKTAKEDGGFGNKQRY